MTPGQLSAKVIAERVAWIRRMVASLRNLPGSSFATFQSDPRNLAAADSYLRRALEAVLDLGRHILAKGFRRGVSEYKDVAKVRTNRLGDLESLLEALLRWINAHPERLDREL